MRLSLDHVILRTADAGVALDALGLPVLAAAVEVGGRRSGVARAGAIDVEVLEVGAEPPERTLGYGLGFVADVALDDVVVELRGRGLKTSLPLAAETEGRRRRAVHVAGLLPEPFPVPMSRARPGRVERAAAAAGARLARVPALARAATRHAGRSMVVVTEYDFDVAAWRASAPAGPETLAVHVAVRADAPALSRFAGIERLICDVGDADPGVTRIVLDGRPPLEL